MWPFGLSIGGSAASFDFRAWPRQGSRPHRPPPRWRPPSCGLSPVIMTVLIPILRRSANFSLTPCLTMSFRWMTPRILWSFATTSGVPPWLEMSLTTTVAFACCRSPPCRTPHSSLTASAAPCGSRGPSKSTPLMRVARRERDENHAPCPAASGRGCPNVSFASTTTLRAFRRLVGEERQLCRHRQALLGSAPSTGMKSQACRLPSVMVPVLSSIRMSTSPAASMARPLMARHVGLIETAHAGNADGGEQRADGRGREAHQQAPPATSPSRRIRCVSQFC